MREKFQRFMIGRYGADELSKMLSGVALGCLILAMFARLYRFLASLLDWDRTYHLYMVPDVF